MTAIVEVTTHALPVKVTTAYILPHRFGGRVKTSQFVPANSKRSFYITGEAELIFKEVEADEMDAEPTK